MRILAGEYKGRSLAQPKSATVRPMSEKVRGALFNVLGDISDTKVLDLYAGSGAIGLEALSRGASSVVAVEKSKPVAITIKKNLSVLDDTADYRLYQTDVRSWLEKDHSEQFDIIAVDPPYEKLELFPADRTAELLASAGVLIVSHSSRKAQPDIKSLEFVKTYVYGDTALSFYKKP